MCTLTWQNEEGLEIFFNRDELKTRSRAEPPREFTTSDGTRYLSPIDPDAGGTWMLVNEYGLVLCLLNRWHEVPLKTFSKSRGQIVKALAPARSTHEVANLLPPLALEASPFDLVAFHQTEIGGFSWNGSKLTPFEPKKPLTSSSYRFEQVKEAREKAFSHCSTLEEFQKNPIESCDPYTVRMNRPDAQTWSRSHLKLTSTHIHWDYWEESPNMEKDALLHQASLPRS